ncbi:molybdenum cofactor biosynthesis protein MoaE [Rhodococcus koreensis]|uniref:Molybdopterin synthase catalytic subunit n=1 Tax=Rhodococcus koreensis TaxID=99653 RepID=A0A1H5EL06_9NOCA|nr:molybdenum cofactor biosynthesis protein MoaE [Rhodococcus koreensis]SED91708.1 molybdopterin synthase catalytic subunit [Rhodococcus koreensis]SED96557.1 molybdopterin synthase subunit MoaE [Rhodococcus koreensis]
MGTLLARISVEPLDSGAVAAAVSGPEAGAVVLFSGVVRNHDGGRDVDLLEYQAHPDAETYLRRCCERVSAVHGFPVAVVHRVGALGVGELALVAAVAAPHRAEAFEACADLVERIKCEVPIWKRQRFADGISEWVGLDECVQPEHSRQDPPSLAIRPSRSGS